VKRVIAAGIILLLGVISSSAIPTGIVDLEPTGVVRSAGGRSTKIGLDGVPLDGQTHSFNFSFGGKFIRLFSATPYILVDMYLPLDGTAPVGSGYIPSAGSGYFTNQNGEQAGQLLPLTGFNDSRDGKAINIQLFGVLPQGERPLNLYGFHVDLNAFLPGGLIDEGGASSESFSVFTNSYRVFGVGPERGLPADLVPESGTTIGFLTVGLVAVALGKRLWRGVEKQGYARRRHGRVGPRLGKAR
jgi:hypothetical protein